MTLARERAIARAYLLSGDEDLREGVVAAQDMGVQVVLLGVPTQQRTNQSAALIREADEHVVLGKDFSDPFFLRPEQGGALHATSASDAQTAGRAFAVEWLAAAEKSSVAALRERRPAIPRELDIRGVARGVDGWQGVTPAPCGDERSRRPRTLGGARYWAVIDQAQTG
jgi:NYN domain